MAENQYNNYQLYRTSPKLGGDMKLDLVLKYSDDRRTETTTKYVVDELGQNKLDEDGNPIVETYTYEYMLVYVVGCHIRPISPMVKFNRPSDERIIDRPHQYNIRRFYQQTRDMFYDCTIDPSLKSDWPIIIPKNVTSEQRKYIKNWDDTYWSGTQRMQYQLYGTTHECLVPLWLEDCSGLKFIIQLGQYNSENGENISAKPACMLDLTLDQDWDKYPNTPQFHKDFVKYFNEYLTYSEIAKPNNDVIKISFKTNTAYVRGLKVEDGTLQTITDYNMVRNIIYRERPLLEFNSILTNAFRDNGLITTQLLNLNLCFCPDTMVSSSYKNAVKNTPNLFVSVTTKCRNTKGKESILQMADLYTNHDYVPRPALNTTIDAVEKPEEGDGGAVEEGTEVSLSNFQIDNGLECGQGPNALDYKHDNLVTAIMHENKIVQPICHWVFANRPDMLFNVYDGFGGWWRNADGDIVWNEHVYGSQNDPNAEGGGNGNSQSTWATKMIGDGDEIRNILDFAMNYQGSYLQDMSSYINGLQFNYKKPENKPSWPDKIYVGLATTPLWTSIDTPFPGNIEWVMDPQYIAIWVNRYELTGKDGSRFVAEDTLPKNESYITSDYDKKYDIGYAHDMDNRYAKYLTNEMNSDHYAKNEALGRGTGGSMLHRQMETGPEQGTFRQLQNAYGLYVCMKRQIVKDDENKDVDTLNIIFWTQRAQRRLIYDEHGNTYYDPQSQIVADQSDSCLSIATIKDVLKKYLNYYGSIIKDENGNWPEGPDIPDLGGLEAVISALDSIKQIGVVWFDNTIYPYIDNTLDQDAEEMTLYKDKAYQAYVFRYDDKIRPAIFPQATHRQNGSGMYANQYPMMYSKNFGRNFLYLKDMYTMDEYLNADPSYLEIPNEFVGPQNTTEGRTDYWIVNPVNSKYMKYVNTGVPPRYNSLAYESIHKLLTKQCQNIYAQETIEDGSYNYYILVSEKTARENVANHLGEVLPSSRAVVSVNLGEYKSGDNLYGDLMYDEPLYRLYGLEMSGEGYLHPIKDIENSTDDTVKYISPYAEYKWFNWSRVTFMAYEIPILNISVTENTAEAMEAAALLAFKQQQGMVDGDGNAVDTYKSVDYEFLSQLYDIKYNFIDYTTEDGTLYTYNYEVKITLK